MPPRPAPQCGEHGRQKDVHVPSTAVCIGGCRQRAVRRSCQVLLCMRAGGWLAGLHAGAGLAWRDNSGGRMGQAVHPPGGPPHGTAPHRAWCSLQDRGQGSEGKGLTRTAATQGGGQQGGPNQIGRDPCRVEARAERRASSLVRKACEWCCDHAAKQNRRARTRPLAIPHGLLAAGHRHKARRRPPLPPGHARRPGERLQVIGDGRLVGRAGWAGATKRVEAGLPPHGTGPASAPAGLAWCLIVTAGAQSIARRVSVPQAVSLRIRTRLGGVVLMSRADQVRV